MVFPHTEAPSGLTTVAGGCQGNACGVTSALAEKYAGTDVVLRFGDAAGVVSGTVTGGRAANSNARAVEDVAGSRGRTAGFTVGTAAMAPIAETGGLATAGSESTPATASARAATLFQNGAGEEAGPRGADGEAATGRSVAAASGTVSQVKASGSAVGVMPLLVIPGGAPPGAAALLLSSAGEEAERGAADDEAAADGSVALAGSAASRGRASGPATETAI